MSRQAQQTRNIGMGLKVVGQRVERALDLRAIADA